jgi:NhaA family Na+:H+ antiporter
LRAVREFIKLEAFSGILLGIAALLGLILANSPARDFYENLLYQKNWLHFINDSLMVLFFLTIGLEIKREILIGELNSRKKIMLPAIGAIFGMILPAVIYLICNFYHRESLRGFAIPTATDIAFALGALSLLGRRIPLSLKIFLMALAIFDDFGAIIIIAIFYTHTLSWSYISLAVIIFILLCLFNKLNIIKSWVSYIILGILLWFCILKSGIHPTIAGVLFALTLPLNKLSLEKQLHPWVAYIILPLFAIANTGIPIQDFNIQRLMTPLSLGIILGLFLGKQLGVFTAVWLSVKYRWSVLPTGTNYKMIYGAALLCGIGFTMSLFIGGLAFGHSDAMDTVRAAVLAGSILSGLIGYLILRCL